MTKILNGKILAHEIRKEIFNEVEKIKNFGYKPPGLAIILVGNNPSSEFYVYNKIKDCNDIGFKSYIKKFPENVSKIKILELIKKLNCDDLIDGFIIQLPLPKHININEIILSINPNKDVDCLHPINIGKMILNIKGFLPATPSGILFLLKKNLIKIEGKHTVIIGRSNIVGKPMSILMSRKSTIGNSTVTLLHSFTSNIKKFTIQADIIITALGIPKFLKSDMIKDRSIIIDVGITRIKNKYSKKYSLIGDVDFDNIYGKASYLTPVPGGVGPLTRAMLLKNTLLAYKNKINIF